MAIVHVRNLAKYGIITDIDPYDLPPEAFSFGTNVRFRNGKITGAPVMRRVTTIAAPTKPRYLLASSLTTNNDSVFIGYLDGSVASYNSTLETDVSVADYAAAELEVTWSHTTLGNVLYLNREDRVPWYYRTSDTEFQELTGAWDESWRCKLLRTCAGALVALNVTKGAASSPTMVKTSSIPTAGVVPASWDHTDPATLATENILSEMQSPIIDGQMFGRNLVIYGLEEAWLMQADNSLQVYSYTKLPFQKGALNSNCSIEIAGKHYVFGVNDIWMHDCTSETSICDKRTRDFIYNGLNLKQAHRCFVTHNATLKEITFCYVSGDRGVKFLSGGVGCNRQAVYNYRDDTWTFDDLPFVFGAANANLDITLLYSTVSQTYAVIGGSYQDQEDGLKRTPIYVGETNALYSLTGALYAFDLYGSQSTATFPVDVNATGPRYLERDGIDLDELNVDLRGYKTISSVYPQARLGVGAAPLTFSYGSADYFGASAAFSPYQEYDGGEKYKLDYTAAGRYLSMRILFDDYKEMALSGFDLDMKVTGHR